VSDVTDDDIPLDISGHESRDRSGRERAAALLDDSEDAGSDATESSGDANGNAVSGEDAGSNDDTHEGNDGEGDESDDGELVEPVEVLVALAEDGEIDPWDIDIVSVTDKFLDRLDEADLQTSGRALFYASVLLRMKSDAMLEADDPEESEPEPWEQAMAEDDEPVGDHDPFATLEAEMDRRLERKRARGMPQTLDELVRDLREAERDNWWKESREYDTSGKSSGSFQQGTQELDYRAADDLRMDDEPTEADVTGTAHTENIDEIIEDVHAAVREHYEQGRDEVLYREIEGAGGSRVETFLGLLFLSHRGQVRLQQDDLFGDLWVQDPAAATGSGEAVAD
jgi:segregation and condensation protein A